MCQEHFENCDGARWAVRSGRRVLYVCRPRDGDLVIAPLCRRCHMTTCHRICPGAPDMPVRDFWLAVDDYEADAITRDDLLHELDRLNEFLGFTLRMA